MVIINLGQINQRYKIFFDHADRAGACLLQKPERVIATVIQHDRRNHVAPVRFFQAAVDVPFRVFRHFVLVSVFDCFKEFPLFRKLSCQFHDSRFYLIGDHVVLKPDGKRSAMDQQPAIQVPHSQIIPAERAFQQLFKCRHM